MLKYRLYLFSTVFSLISCIGYSQSFDIQGHRGARGLMPENSIPGFIKAIDLGVTTLEMDVVISADGKVVVSHDPYISSDFCLDKSGKEIEKEKEIRIFDLNYEEILLYDCGSKGNEDFPEQEKISVYKPLLSEVIDTCENYVETLGLKAIQYNIEIKSTPSGDGTLNPVPENFTEMVFKVIDGNIPRERVNIQSFDIRILQSWKKKYPDYRLSYLIGNTNSVSKNIDELGFMPDIYSPNYRLISREMIEYFHKESVKVIPWTINSKAEMKKFIDMGVDGIITDYPNRYFEIISAQEK